MTCGTPATAPRSRSSCPKRASRSAGSSAWATSTPPTPWLSPPRTTLLTVPRSGLLDEELLARARDTSLTRPGTGPAQNLEDGTSNGALSAFYDRTLAPGGYEVPGLTDRGFFGGADGDLRLYSRPDFGEPSCSPSPTV